MNLPQIEVQWPVSIVSIVLATRRGNWSGMGTREGSEPHMLIRHPADSPIRKR